MLQGIQMVLDSRVLKAAENLLKDARLKAKDMAVL
jgi:hypothetical protein